MVSPPGLFAEPMKMDANKGCDVHMIWDPRFLDYDFGEGHPFTERSRAAAVELLDATGFFSRHGIRREAKVKLPSEEILRNFHTPRHIARVRRESESPNPGLLDRGDTPAFPGVWEASTRIVSATVEAVRTVSSGGALHATNLAGGLHHASPGAASGFCVFNDIGVALATGLKEGWFRKVAYIDIDAHHGDGVMYGFYEDARVLDIDFHQDGRTLFPGTGSVGEVGAGEGRGTKANIPLPPGTGDGDFISLFRRIVPPLIENYGPDLILMQCGVDAHSGDPLAHLEYTRVAYEEALATVHRLSHDLCGGKMVLVGGGGYQASNVARILAQDAIVLSGEDVPGADAALPEPWRKEFLSTFGESAPTSWGENPPASPHPWTPEAREKIVQALSHHLRRDL